MLLKDVIIKEACRFSTVIGSRATKDMFLILLTCKKPLSEKMPSIISLSNHTKGDILSVVIVKSK